MKHADNGSSSTYEKVIHKKAEGRLVLNDDSLIFQSPATTASSIYWINVMKHQVSPASHPKSLLKVVLVGGKPQTFQLATRPELETLRKDISKRLQTFRADNKIGGKKRKHSETAMVSPGKQGLNGKTTTTSFGELDSTAMAVTRSSLLAANPTLRAQHQYLVQETQTLTEDDFWKTHQDLLEEEYARICGMTKAGTSSLLQSHLQLLTGRVTLGVEEMRQIFILYPAVHKAYEEKVPLELSDEQFWRKYLESEYFHRDRGRIGAASRRDGKNDKDSKNKNGLSIEDQEARAAAVGTDDLFSRYDQKIRESSKKEEGSRKWGTKLAVGQFDLASTFETERGNVLGGPKDNHPPNAANETKGDRVIQKYNRHWAMVMHPEDAVAGSDLMEVARRSVTEVLPGDEDAKAGGGTDADMTRLVGFATAKPGDANHALGVGLAESNEYEELTLKNIEAYSGLLSNSSADQEDEERIRQRNVLFANTLVQKISTLVADKKGAQLKEAFPNRQLGFELLKHLTNRMAKDSKTDADALEIVSALSDDFKNRLLSYFRRSSELLRHFFGLRKLADGNHAYTQKLEKIVTGMEHVYREMEEMRQGLDATGETGETTRKMCLQIMDQLDWAFKLHQKAGSSFVTIEKF